MYRNLKPGGKVRKPRLRIAIPKSLRHALIGVGVLILLFGIAGTAYTLVIGRYANNSVVTKEVATPTNSIPKPVQRAVNAKESASVQSITTPVIRGTNASITVRTNPDSTCKISVVYNNVASTDSGLASKVADVYGMVTWAWTVDGAVPLGTWPVKVTCSYQTRSAVVQADLVVTK